MAYETPLTIAEVMQDISNNKYVLPSIQREYVWDTEQVETLFDSLMQIILLEHSCSGKLKKQDCRIMTFMSS